VVWSMVLCRALPFFDSHLEAYAHLASFYAYFDEVVLLLDELVGLLVTWHMIHGLFDLFFLGSTTLHISSCIIGSHMPSWSLQLKLASLAIFCMLLIHTLSTLIPPVQDLSYLPERIQAPNHQRSTCIGRLHTPSKRLPLARLYDTILRRIQGAMQILRKRVISSKSNPRNVSTS
jgi:hypothetical protein